jgi:hypothetical protein
MIYAEKGDVVTCENGHDVFKFGKDVSYGEMQDAYYFIFFNNQIKPRIGLEPEKCLCHCGAEYFKGFGTFHFKDGWRR